MPRPPGPAPRVPHALLTADEERELAARVAEGDAAARQRMILCNLRLVAKVALRYQGRGLDLEELIAEGTLGLIRAVDDYRPTEFGARLGTYAYYWIKMRITRAIVNLAPTIRVPDGVALPAARWARAERSLVASLGREPLDDEVAAAARIPPDLLARVADAIRCRGVRGMGGSGEEARWLPELAEDRGDPDGDREASDEARALMGRVARLDPRYREVLTLRFGLGGVPPKTLVEISKILHVSKERCRQVETLALNRLRDDCRTERPS